MRREGLIDGIIYKFFWKLKHASLATDKASIAGGGSHHPSQPHPCTRAAAAIHLGLGIGGEAE